MSKLRVRCPQGHLLEVELVHAGKQVQCPMCQTIMLIPELPQPKTATATGSPAPLHRDLQKDEDEDQDDFEEENRPQKKSRSSKAGLKPVRLGLNYQIAQLYVLVLGAIFIGVLAGVVAANNPDNAMRRAAGAEPQGASLVTVFSVLLRVTYVVLGVISCVYLLQVPERTRTKPFAIAYVALELVYFLVSLLGFFAGQGSIGAYIITFVGFCLVLTSYICFVVLLKRLAEYVKRYKLAQKANGLLIMLGVMTGGFLLAFFGAIIGGTGVDQNVGAGSILGLALMVFGCFIMIVVFIWSIFRYLRLIHEVRDAL